ncbi:MAG: sulfide:quinone oxidoreductase [Solirubrobacterales bacterium]|jgi:sulfide:quinone oxidoreductase|nr:sulfide:quinone oxidoreductase [Solirubrobacterales bacterium]
MKSSGASKVLIVGGGVGALEAALAIHDLAGEKARVEICAGRADFVYRPFAVGEPYGASRVLRYDLDRLADLCGAEFRHENIAAVDPALRCATGHDGTEISYDYLVVACGARLLWSVPGAVTFWGVAEEGEMLEVVGRLREGRLRRLVLTMPGGHGWALPAYELALMAAAEVSRHRIAGTRITVVTPEEGPLKIFGRRACEQVADLLADHSVEVLAGTHPVKYESGLLAIVPGEPIGADAVVSLPRLEGRHIEGLPYDAGGFVPIDDHARIAGLPQAFAVGDVTNFPVKQGGIATQQADAAAEAIAADLGCDVEANPLDPVLRGILWTGSKPRYLFGWLGGGHGETSVASERPPWPIDNPSKLIGRYLTPFLAGAQGASRAAPSSAAR